MLTIFRLPSHRTYAPLTYPSSIIAAACVYTASLLSLQCIPPSSAASSVIRHFEDQTKGDTDQQDAALCCPIDGVEGAYAT